MTCWAICAARLQLITPSPGPPGRLADVCENRAARTASVPMPAAASSALETTVPSGRTTRSIPRVHLELGQLDPPATPGRPRRENWTSP
jgi:hypothetical protein